MWKKRQPAFTLIEIMVTVAIIGILAVAGVNTYIRAMMNGRDGRRKADIAQIAQALVTYRYEKGKYDALSSLTTDYIGNMPKDPATGSNYIYYSCASGKKFILCARLEATTGNASAYSNTNCTFTAASNNGSYQCVTNP